MASCMRSRLRASRRLRGARAGLVALLIAGFGGFAPPGFAVGLGEINVDSSLNERLAASIPLIDVGDLQPDEIRITLASAEDFERVGVERFFFLNDLRFRVEVGQGGGTVRVLSEGPITEPYLNFLVQLQWPQGRMLKEYTVLLDPPTFSQAAAPAVSSAVQAAPDTATSGVIERPREQAPASVAPAPRPSAPVSGAPVRESGARAGDEYRMGDRPETLWSIASRNRPSSGVSVQQTMLAIQRLNPEAFVDGNINRLKAGQTLRLPSEEEVRSVSAAEALEQVALQDQNWRSGVTQQAIAPAATDRAAIDATPGAAAPAPAGDSEGRLRIVAGGGESVSGSPDAAEAEAAADTEGEALAVALEERDRLNLEVADLTSELTREKELAASQLEVKDRQLEVKDQQIAEMQAELARLRESSGSAGEKQDQNAVRPATSSPVAWWQAPEVLGAGTIVLVLLLAAGLIAARRRRAAAALGAAFVPPAHVEPVAARPPTVASEERLATEKSATPLAADSAVATAAVAGVAAATVGAASAGSEAVPGSGSAAKAASIPEAAAGDELVDVVGEAEIYIAYGRYGQAIALLQSALADDPERHDARLKLLEIFAETGDRSGFERAHAELSARGVSAEVLAAADALAEQFPAVGASAAGQMAMLPDIEFEAVPPPTHDPAVGAPVPPGDAGPADYDGLEFELPEEPLPALQDEPGSGFVDEPSLELEDLSPAFDAEPARFETHSGRAPGGGATADDEMPVFDEPVPDSDLAELDIDLEPTGSETVANGLQPVEPSLTTAQSDVLGGDRGIDFRLEADDLEGLDADDLALEMDGVPPPADDEFEFADEGDSTSTKLDLARAYSEMGDPEGAREILLEVLKEGTDAQQQAARELLEQL